MGPCQTCFDWDFAFVARHLKIQRKIPWYPRISLGESLQETPTSVFRIKHQQLFYSLSQLNPSIKNYSKVRVKKGIFFLDFIMFHHISSQLNGLIGVFHYKPYIYIYFSCFTMFHHVSHVSPWLNPYVSPCFSWIPRNPRALHRSVRMPSALQFRHLKVVVRLHILRDVHHRGGQDQLWPGFEKWGWVKTLVPCREPQKIAGLKWMWITH